MKDVKKLLSEQASEILPDDKAVKQNIRRELGIGEEEAVLSYAHGGEKHIRGSKGKIAAICAAALACILCLCVLLPALFRNRPQIPDNPVGNKFAQITDADSFYAYGAASVGMLISSGQNAAAPASAAPAASPVRATSASLSPAADANSRAVEPDEGLIEEINRYLSLVESLLSDGAIEGTGIAGENGYEYGMTVQYTDLLGSPASYTMYYDKEFLYGETEDGESEENYAISGILRVGAAEYPVEGMYKTETEEGESENELYFRAFTDESGSSYIEVRQEYESEEEDGEAEIEQEYVYSVYAGGELTERTTIEYESEDGELELLMRISEGGRTETLAFRDETENGERVLRVSGTIDGSRVQFRVYVREGQYHYVFEDGSTSDFDRFDKDDDHDGKDDDDDDNDDREEDDDDDDDRFDD